MTQILNNTENEKRKDMKRILYCAVMTLLIFSQLFLSSCGDAVDYTMRQYTTGALEYSLPEHFVLTEHTEADAFYVTLNCEVAVYSYTHDEFDLTFSDYNGNYTARDVAEFIVDKHDYKCSVQSNEDNSAAVYSFMYYTEDQSGHYYTNAIKTDGDNVVMLSFSCPLDRLDRYENLITEILSSMKMTSSFEIG